MKFFVLLFAVASPFMARAELLNLTPGPHSLNTVNISSEGTATVSPNKSYSLKTVGAGLRTKQVFGPTDIYVAQLLVSDASQFQSPADPIAALGKQESLAMRLSFLLDVPSETVVEQFREAFAKNKIREDNPDIQRFIQVATNAGDARNKGSLTVFITKNADGSETLAYENIAKGKAKLDVHTYAAGLSAKIMAIWLGVPADAGLEALKSQILSGNL